MLKKVLELLSELDKAYGICCILNVSWIKDYSVDNYSCALVIPAVGCFNFDSLELILKYADIIRKSLDASLAVSSAALELNNVINEMP